MTKKSEITQENFDRLLNWLDKDKETAARKYHSIYERLVKIFSSRNAHPPEELADQTMDRAIRKADYLLAEYTGEPALYFYNIANKVFFEYLRKPKAEPISDNFTQKELTEDMEVYYDCLNECLQTLLPEHRELFIKYFKYEKQTKIDEHKKMAQGLSLSVTALRTRVYRIRRILEDCVRECVHKKNV